MNKKIFIQFFLIIILLFFLSLFLSKYFFYNQEITDIKLEDEKNNVNQNLITDIKYSSKDKNGNIYSLKAKYGEVDLDNPNKIFLTNVNGSIKVFDKNEDIQITSNFANFNNKTFETEFFELVKIVSKNDYITGDNLYIVFNASEDELKVDPEKIQNKAILSGNVNVIREKYNMYADILEIDLISWDSKVYMTNKNEKVTINNFK